MQRPLLFDAILFDLDGTLVATDRFWVQAARTGARRAFEELELERPLPSRAEWMQLIGHGLEDGFRTLFEDLSEVEWRHVLALCEEEEHRLLDSGGAALMPGAREVLLQLALKGARMGLASNCSLGYLEHMIRELGLAEVVHDGYCLESPGIRSKGDMIARLLDGFGSRSAIMVGDRAGDRNSAWENGIPHVHCAFGFATADEEVEAEAVIQDMGELLPVLDRRGVWIEDTLHAVGVDLEAEGPMILGVTGGKAAGKTLFARDAARLLRAAGQPAIAVSLDGYRISEEPLAGAGEPAASYDLERLERELFEPLEQGAVVRLPPEACVDRGVGRYVPQDAVVLLEGPYLLDPRLQRHLDRALVLEVPEDVRWRRIAGREGRVEGLPAIEAIRADVLPAEERHAERYDPTRLADLVVDAGNPLGRDPAPAPA